MRWKDLNLHPSRLQLRQFGALATVLLLAWCGWSVWAGAPAAKPVALGLAAAGTALLAAFRPGWLRGVFVGLLIVTFPIGWVVSQVILLIIFYLLITPLAVYYRWRGRDVLCLRPPSKEAATFWESKRTNPDPKSYFRQF